MGSRRAVKGVATPAAPEQVGGEEENRDAPRVGKTRDGEEGVSRDAAVWAPRGWAEEANKAAGPAGANTGEGSALLAIKAAPNRGGSPPGAVVKEAGANPSVFSLRHHPINRSIGRHPRPSLVSRPRSKVTP